ncbi:MULTISPECIES: PAS domain S-box protein [Nostocales]|uniref:Circadian input-output histidine kinase CikA n=4 Tax=Nostocales TaxID=1161 RepID=A0A8S9T4T6_9CYAN|nr:PAS domain S-box protein [Tolypothrix bouteillei]KAF3887395.1 PAS domain S-box protein [Tolypothrix bouteillei VB521301]
MKRDASGKFVRNWGSETKQRVSVSLTSTAWRLLDEEARLRGLSRSETIERIARSFGGEPHPNVNVDGAKQAQNALLESQIIEQQQAIARLDREKQDLSALLENAPDIISRIDRKFRHLYVSPSIKLATGIPSERFIGKTNTDLGMPGNVCSIWNDGLQQVFATGQEQIIEYSFPTPKGMRWYQSRIVPEFASDGSVETVLNIARDVTDYKYVERALRESEERLQLSLAAAKMVGWDMDLKTNRVVCTPNACEIWGIQEGTKEDFFAVIHPEDRDRMKQAIQQAFAGEASYYNQEYRTISPEGVVRWLNSQGKVYHDATGRGVRMIGVSVDITERKQIEAEREMLRTRSERLLRQQQFSIQLNDAIRTIQDPKEIMWQVVCATGKHFQVTRCTYGDIDPTQEYVIVNRDYCNGVISVVGNHHMNSFGVEIIAELKQGKTIVVDDVDVDPRTCGSGEAAFDAIQTKSLLCVPLVKQGRFVALFVLHHVSPRQWTEEDVALMEQIAEQTWLAVERSRAEKELRESEAHLQLALKVGRMGAWDWDVQTGAMLWSEGHFTVLGLQPNECQPSYEVWASRVHPDDLAQTEAKLQQAMLDQKEYHHEYRLLWLDGSVHWVEARGQCTYDSQGNPKHSIGAVIDITGRKQTEHERETLLERERIARTQVEAAQRQLANIFETSPVGIGLLDAQQRFVAINEALAQINGLTREQHLGHSIPELFGQSDPKLVEVFYNIYTTGNSFISPNFAVSVPGRSDRTPGYHNVYYLPTINSNNEVEDVLVYVVDITEQVRLEQGQRFLSEASTVLASSLDYQTTLERVAQLAVPELADWCTVHIVEENGCIEQIAVAHNDPAKLLWAHEIRQKYPLNPNDPRGTALTLRTGQSDILPDIPDELLVQAARDPEHLHILRQVGFRSAMTVPLRTQDRILGVITFVSSESGRRYNTRDLQLAEELARRASLAIDNTQLYRVAQLARDKAESANRVKDEFLAVLSHELRSPLNPILGWTKMLRSHRLDATRTEQALETIERNAKLQAQLIEDLLDVSRILQGKMALNVAPVNLAATIEAAKETVRLAAEAKNIHIQTTLKPILGTVSGDRNRLQQVFWNLLSNAVKFTPSGGRVEVHLEQVGMYAQIQVKDTGIGITPEFLPYVFEYFRQENSTITRQFGGLGLGLAIVRHFTELHGGTVWATSPGENLGATFAVRLPLNAIEQELSSDENPSGSTAHLTGIEILVVDDDADMRELAKFILTQSGARVTTVASAVEALNFLNRFVPDLLLCDIGMPKMDGYSLIQHIRKLSPQQGGTIRAIALTAYAGEINQQKAVAAGFNMHLSKPFEPENLVEKIVQLLHPLHQTTDQSDFII